MTDEVAFLDAGGIEDLDDVIGHRRDGVGIGERLAGAAGAALVVGDDPVMLGKGRALRLPIGADAAHAGGEQDGDAPCPALNLVMRDAQAAPPTWAMLLISTNAPGFTRPHWMQKRAGLSPGKNSA